jgi:hypothetical protein
MKGKENATTSGGVGGNAAVSRSVADEGENPKTRKPKPKTNPRRKIHSSLSRKAAELNVSTRRSTKRSASES